MSVRSITQLLWLVALIMLVAGFFLKASHETKNAVEVFIRDYQGILTSIGTLGLVGLLTIVTTHISNISASNRDISNRKVSAELKIVEFRQQWIDNLRNDISEFLSLSGGELDEAALARLHLLSARVQLRLNPYEDTSLRILEEVNGIFNAIKADDTKALTSAQTKLQVTISESLKNEWDRIKSDLKIAQVSVGKAL